MLASTRNRCGRNLRTVRALVGDSTITRLRLLCSGTRFYPLACKLIVKIVGAGTALVNRFGPAVSATLAGGYRGRRWLIARPRVTSSAYSKSPPTGRP